MDSDTEFRKHQFLLEKALFVVAVGGLIASISQAFSAYQANALTKIQEKRISDEYSRERFNYLIDGMIESLIEAEHQASRPEGSRSSAKKEIERAGAIGVALTAYCKIDKDSFNEIESMQGTVLKYTAEPEQYRQANTSLLVDFSQLKSCPQACDPTRDTMPPLEQAVMICDR